MSRNIPLRFLVRCSPRVHLACPAQICGWDIVEWVFIGIFIFEFVLRLYLMRSPAWDGAEDELEDASPMPFDVPPRAALRAGRTYAPATHCLFW